MVKPDNYQQLLDDYLAEVAAAAVQFEDVLKQQTAALQQLIDEEKVGSPNRRIRPCGSRKLSQGPRIQVRAKPVELAPAFLIENTGVARH